MDSTSGESVKFTSSKDAIAIKISESNNYEATFTLVDKITLGEVRRIYESLQERKLMLGKQFFDMSESDLQRLISHGEIMQIYDKNFCWQAGEYEVQLSVKSPNKARFVARRYKFELKDYQVEILKENLEKLYKFKIDLWYENLLSDKERRQVENISVTTRTVSISLKS
jgi:hypothetical protein